MKLINLLALSTIAFNTIGFSTDALSADLTITSQTQTISQNNKVHTYSGKVQIELTHGITARSTSQSVSVLLAEDQTVLSGDVEIDLDYAIAKTNKAVFIKRDDTTLIQMDSVTLFYK